eukprot:TRINITY_DN20248_c0_g1_i1.p1 TRINITY_DN20248_c0_g1~~TRINITY_DN20248_c0_g1_i1.p1  ORF type:complete len:311 (+),score=44.72 TRINITY_DN20248_c0_g1_i1:106-1038(+)
MLKRNGLLRVVFKAVDDAQVPETTPQLPASKHIKGRLLQLRQSIGMTEEEINHLVAENGLPPQVELDGHGTSSAVAKAVPEQRTWADIVKHKEQTGQLYSPRTIQEAFPYLGGMKSGVPDFKDEHREEQMLAHLDAKTNHPMSVYAKLVEHRMLYMFFNILFFFFGYSLVKAYCKQHVYDYDAGVTSRADHYITPQEAEVRVATGDEPMVPIFRSYAPPGGLPIVNCEWIPISQLSQKMWKDREGPPSATRGVTQPGLVKGNEFGWRENYHFPAAYSGMVDNPGEQMECQRRFYERKEKFQKLRKAMENQ